MVERAKARMGEVEFVHKSDSSVFQSCEAKKRKNNIGKIVRVIPTTVRPTTAPESAKSP